MPAKDLYPIRSHYLPEFSYYSVPQVAQRLNTSRQNAKEIIYGGVAELLLDLHRQRDGYPASTSREFTEGFVKRSSFEKLDLPEPLHFLHHRDPANRQEQLAINELPNSTEVFMALEGRPVLSKRGLEILEAAPFADPNPRALNVRVRAGRFISHLDSEADRDYIGWNWQFTEEEASEATRQWWPILTKYDSTGLPFIVSLGGFVVRCGRIVNETTNHYAVSYEVDWHDEEVRSIWEGKRVENKQGNIIVYLGE